MSYRTAAAFLIVILSTLSIAMAADAQAPHEEWWTIETEHYRVHYPKDYEDWALHAAERLESVREVVGQEVGFVPEQTIDVVVMDPVARANGSAWPFIGYPRMWLWTSPPGPESVIGNYGNWVELLTIHEQAHLAHLLRPSRNRMQQVLGSTLGLGPITLRAPRWAIEGYATVIEGDLTASGRPQSDIRAAILRKWAQQGRLPSYSQLSSDSSSYLGMSMAYLAGSAYLEWLRDREGADSFRNVWARLTAVRTRSFDEAFGGVYGESPAHLYARFRAELTHQALELENQLGAGHEGQLWQDLSWQTGIPAVSPDGSQIAIVLRKRESPSRLVVWEMGEDPESLEEWDEAVRELIERDPEDVPAVRRKPLSRKPVHELVGRDGADMLTPRWLPDGSILFVRYEPDADGFLHPDLFRWRPENGAVDRLSYGADLREPSPVSATEVVAVRRRYGKSSLVLYDLETRAERLLTEPSLTTVYGWPRVDRKGERVAFSRHDGRWHLSIIDLASRSHRDVELPEDSTTVAWPEWSPDGESLYATVGAGGWLDIWRFDVSEAEAVGPLTRSFGAAMAPSTGDGSRLFFLGLDADGLDLRVLDPVPENTLSHVDHPVASLVPIARPERPEGVAPEIATLQPARPYGLGDLETRWLFGGGRTPTEETWEAGIRVGDIVGRFDSLVVGALSNGGPEGGSARAVWRGWPVAVEGHLFAFDRERSRSPVSLPDPAPDLDRRGAELIGSWSRLWRGGRLEIEGGFLADQLSYEGTEQLEVEREIGFLSMAGTRRLLFDPWVAAGTADLSIFLGNVNGDSPMGWTAELGVAGGLKDHSVSAWYRRGEIDETTGGGLVFVGGGAPTSLTPSFDHLVHVWSPGLVEGAVGGPDYESWRGELETSILPVVPFYEAHRAAETIDGDWTELAGLRFDMELEPFPLLKIPGAILSIGGAYILDGPLEDEIEWWISTRWKLD